MKRKWLFRILLYGLVLLIALLIFCGFYGFVKDDNWLAVSALATLILAFAAFWAIWQNHQLQIRERRERLLNEIIEWALDIMVCGVERDIELLWDTQDRGFSVLRQMANTFKYLLRKSTYTKTIILPSWDNLSKDVEEIREQLDLQIKYIEEYIEEPSEDEFNITANHREKVNKLAVKIIKDGCTILTKNLD